MNVPLNPNANLSKYQTKTITPNVPFLYRGLKWTLKQVTAGLSYGAKQATAGNWYIIVTLGVINNTAQDFYPYPTNDIRFSTVYNTSPPDSFDLADPVPSQSTQSGNVVFLMPQSVTTFTLLMLARPDANPSVAQAAQNFQIQ